MAKRIVHDIVIPRRKAELIESLHHKRKPDETLFERPRRTDNKSGRWLIFGLVTILICVVIGMYVTTLFSYATVRVVPRSEKLTLDDSFLAAPIASKDALVLKSMKINASETDKISGSGKQRISRKATGRVVLYNKHDTKPQHLVARTRLETPEGQLFRLDSDVVIPGLKVVNGKIVPGAATTTVSASLPGRDYNVGLKDFTLPAFKGTPRFSTIYGRSETPLTDGYVGEEVIATKEELLAVETELTTRLRTKLLEEARTQTPRGYILYSDATFISYDPLQVTSATQGKVPVQKKAYLEGLLLDKDELLLAIARKKLPGYKGDSIQSNGLENLNFSISNKETIQETDELKMIKFRIKGALNILYTFDTEAFRASLAGVSKKQYLTILSQYGAIDKAVISLTPSWATSFPAKPERIKIEMADE